MHSHLILSYDNEPFLFRITLSMIQVHTTYPYELWTNNLCWTIQLIADQNQSNYINVSCIFLSPSPLLIRLQMTPVVVVNIAFFSNEEWNEIDDLHFD